jgi:hypothetical protein
MNIGPPDNWPFASRFGAIRLLEYRHQIAPPLSQHYQPTQWVYRETSLDRFTIRVGGSQVYRPYRQLRSQAVWYSYIHYASAGIDRVECKGQIVLGGRDERPTSGLFLSISSAL